MHDFLCDRCTARAKFRYAKESEPELVLQFCGHHAQKFLDGLAAQGFVVAEEYEKQLAGL